MKHFVLALALAILTGPAVACEEYKTLAQADIKEFRDKLTDPNADPIDRLFAFQELACSDSPVMRDYAIRTGLANASDELVRNQIALEALLQKQRIEIEIIPKGAERKAQEYFKERYNNMIMIEVADTYPEDGCVVFRRNDSDSCTWMYLKLDGPDAILAHDRSFSGKFELVATGELVGFVRNSDYGQISARIDLR